MQTFGAPNLGSAEPSTASPSPPQWLKPALPLATGVLLVSMVAQFRIPLLPAMGAELAMSPTQLGLVATMFAVGRLALDMPVGRLADRADPLRLLSAAALAMAVGSVVMAVAPSAGWIYASSVLLGAASATGNTTGMTALSGSVPASRRGSAMALYSGALLGGQALGPAVSGAIAAFGTWRAAAGGAAVGGLLVAVGAWAWSRRPLGTGGSVVRDASSPTTAALTPIERTVLYSVGFSVFFTLGAMPMTLVPLLGAAQFGLGAASIGLALGVGGIARMVGAAVTGGISDRYSRRSALLPGLVLQAAGVGLLAIGSRSLWWLLAIILMSLGSSGNAVAATMLGDRTHGAMLGRTLGRYRFAGDIGLVVGPASAAFAYEVAGARAAVALVTGVLLVCAVAAALVIPETHAAARDRR